MIQLLLFVVALGGSTIAAAFDVKTTEIPDKISYAMIAIALVVYGAQSVMARSYMPILNSCAVGGVLFVFGFLLYYFGQWGGGDAKILAAIGFLLPNTNVFNSAFPNTMLWFPFPASYLFNVFFIGAIYMLLYAFALAARNKKIIHEFKRDVKATANIIVAASISLFVVFLFVNWFLMTRFQTPLSTPFPTSLVDNFHLILMGTLTPIVLTIGVFLVWRFVRIVENVAFKKKIPVKKLNVGDVLLSSKFWEGIDEKEMARIRQSNKRYVWIKEGVPFAPAFPLALLFTAYLGDAVLFLLRFLG